MHYHQRQTAAKKECGHFEQRSAYQAKKQSNFCGYLEPR